ncbi:ImmA/IrrE family metallo-endopeptidase [Alteromonas sp. CI.11.F.A3]|uniref:ImmA/IrrE family metallo-endopeptidase n=1 Tax=Alteromonas sp. CI.11.F.A3 TaxID=3079555 RepID=UPI0029424188|nr:ImmA/IrrE family metallo-endopeptidase [Alteromonas sp. CI.11.F.A3]WOI39320.1 ImmA/IrrE family metallo-endopeptidase [Alteromonas sp. CI.11.F.A3]
MPESYQLRGIRVRPLSEIEIAKNALSVCEAFRLTKRKVKSIDQFFESLYILGITISVIESEEWLQLTKGFCNPSERKIMIPEHIYQNACIGEREALAVMFHEIGHLFLNHQPILHFSDVLPKVEEDAEWQADTFAEVILKHLGYDLEQLSLDFYM